MQNEELLEIAKKALENAYTPYSKFNVGAALLTKEGKVYSGCNIENASYGATVCAERVAIFNAVGNGEKKFEKIAIVSQSDSEVFKNVAGEFTFPCGICRQVMVEFGIEKIVLQNSKNEIKEFMISELMPYSFNVN